MSATESGMSLLNAEGVVHRADGATRVLKVFVRGQLWAFEVPANCHICRGAERVPLRRLRSRDHVWIAYEVVGGARVAHSVLATWLPVSAVSVEAEQGRET